ncbi:MAG: bifunctional cobalt-precorrin-7 (C(5))-methyltransferase/cobalt-precorrin-6B (C(15))-methyltransferase [Deferrisomatales bacterium]
MSPESIGARPRVHVIGVAPGARELPAEAAEAVRCCALLAGARRHLELVDGFAGEVLPFEEGLVRAVDRAAEPDAGPAALLASGDPGFFGIAATVLRRVPREAVRIWPAVSSMQLAFARAGESWSDARFVSLHGRPLETLAPALGAPKVGLFTDATNRPDRIAAFLEEAGWGDLEMVVAEDLGMATERLRRGPPGAFRAWAGSDLNVVLLIGGGPDRRPLGPGLPEEAFAHRAGMITKAEVRAVALGLLRLPRQGILWDVGAGSGSVSVEACLLAPGLRAYAVERSPEGAGLIAENRRRHRVAGLVPVCGEAPGSLGPLPDPDAVYVGGSGGELDGILDTCWERLRPEGTLVVAAVVLETLGRTLAWGARRGLGPEVTEVGAARSRTVAGRHLMDPVRAVHLIRFAKEAGGGANGSR